MREGAIDGAFRLNVLARVPVGAVVVRDGKIVGADSTLADRRERSDGARGDRRLTRRRAQPRELSLTWLRVVRDSGAAMCAGAILHSADRPRRSRRARSKRRACMAASSTCSPSSARIITHTGRGRRAGRRVQPTALWLLPIARQESSIVVRISISLAEQRLRLFDDYGRVVSAYPVFTASGRRRRARGLLHPARRTSCPGQDRQGLAANTVFVPDARRASHTRRNSANSFPDATGFSPASLAFGPRTRTEPSGFGRYHAPLRLPFTAARTAPRSERPGRMAVSACATRISSTCSIGYPSIRRSKSPRIRGWRLQRPGWLEQ